MSDPTGEILFCTKCAKDLTQPKLIQAWRNICIYYIIEGRWYCVPDLDYFRDLLRNLEIKGYLISIDVGQRLYAKPLCVYEGDGNNFFCCVCEKKEE